MNQKVLVVGGTGLLGSCLIPHLKLKNYQVIESSRHGEHKVDFSFTEQANTFLDATEPDFIINLAAHTNVDKCEADPNSAYLLNCKLVENISHWMKNRQTHLIQISTDMVYDKAGFNKESNTCIRNYYAISKMAGELATINSSSTVLRTNFFGKSKAANRSSLTDWIYQNLKDNTPINIIDDVYFTPLTTETLSSAIVSVLKNPRKGIYNLGSKTMLSKAEFSRQFVKDIFPNAEKLMSPIHLNDLNLKATRPHNMAMDSSLFQETFGFKLPTLEEELNICKKEYINNEK